MHDSERRHQIQLDRLKRWIWIYFWLLIFEGVLRKWVLPGLSAPLLLIRDPVALMIYYRAYRCGKFSMKTMWPFALLAAAMVLLACMQVSASITTLPIALFGLRSYLLHLPLMLVVAGTVDGEDLDKFGRWLMVLSIPMLLLVLAQFNAPANAWVNAGAGENAKQIVAAGGHIRPAGTFSYGIGMQYFLMLTAAFFLDALMRRRSDSPWLVYSALLAAIGMVPLLGSRGVLFSLGALAILTAFSGLSHGERLVGLTKIVCVLLLGGLLAIQFSFFNEAIEAMKLRWQQAAKAEGTIHQVLNTRVWGIVATGGQAATVVPLLGRGIGAGSKLASAAQGNLHTFLAGENEWERVVVEFGPIFGFLFLAARLGLAGYLTLQAFQAMRRNSVLGWLLLPGVVPLIVFGAMEQSTSLGFMAFGGGLCLAAARCTEPSPAYLVYAPSAA